MRRRFLALALLAGCAGAAEEPCGEVRAVEVSAARQAVETGLRHLTGVVTFAWLEADVTCATGGVVDGEGGDAPFPLLPIDGVPDRWGTWHLADTPGTWLEVDLEDGGALCAGEGCDPWPAALDDVVGPPMSAEDFYFDVWLAHDG